MDPAQAAKLKQRTLVGGSLALGVVLLLWFAARDRQHVVVPFVGWCLALGGALELARMGRGIGREWLAPLVGGMLAAFLFHWLRLIGDAWGSAGVNRAPAGWWTDWIVVGGFAAVCLPLRRLPRGPFGVVPVLGAVGVAALLVVLAVRSSDATRAGLGLTLVGGVLALDLAFTVGRPAAADASRAVGGRLLSGILPVGLALWVIPALPALTHVDRWLGWKGLAALLLLSKIGDVFGYYVGNAIGRSHPFPNLSPGKTTAGCVGSLVAGCAFGAGCVAWGWLPSARLGLLGGALAGAAVNVAAQAGDLLESKAKRATGVKDSGTLFGPSGGFLDLTDSLLLGVPAALLVWPLLFEASAGDS